MIVQLSYDLVPLLILPIAASLYSIVAWFDITRRIIPDMVSIILAGFGILVILLGSNWAAALSTIGLAAGTFLALALLCMMGKMGGGDVKLISASVLLVGAGSFLDFMLLTALAGGVLALIYLVAFVILKHLPAASAAVPAPPRKMRNAFRLGLLWRIERRRILRRSSVPYGVAIAGGSLLSLALRYV
jgi:prepilin peptidase CpaA